MTEVVALTEFTAWYESLTDSDTEAVNRLVDLLEQHGVALGYPHSSDIKGSSIALRELRGRSGGGVIRVLYVFDPARQAVLILGGDKQGDDRFYKRLVPRAEKLFKQYLKER